MTNEAGGSSSLLLDVKTIGGAAVFSLTKGPHRFAATALEMTSPAERPIHDLDFVINSSFVIRASSFLACMPDPIVAPTVSELNAMPKH
jgi:hypothetical protein